jgi:hypothetical protein
MRPKPPSRWQQRRRQEAAHHRHRDELRWRCTHRYDDFTLWHQLAEWLLQHPRLEDLPPDLAPLVSDSPEASAVRSQWAAWGLLPVTAAALHRWILRSDWQECLAALEHHRAAASPEFPPHASQEE